MFLMFLRILMFLRLQTITKIPVWGSGQPKLLQKYLFGALGALNSFKKLLGALGGLSGYKNNCLELWEGGAKLLQNTCLCFWGA